MTDEFRALAAEITSEMGAGWTLTDPANARRSLRMVHTDGRTIDLWNSDPQRVTASGRFPVTELTVTRVETSAAVSRGAAAIARQISGERFMAVYAKAFARVTAHNERQERRAAERKRVREFLGRFIPAEDGGRGSLRRPGIEPKQAYERKADGSGWEFTDRVVVNLEFRDLSEAEARMIMRAYSIAVGHTPEFLRPAA
ncbi:hypothetical protein ACFV42_46575 [Streptomyces solisilvae]|uniref:hypothetical protein n=1 Tax=Streptomyces malaysiensis TaxID=92644 RepID=UPI0036B012A8